LKNDPRVRAIRRVGLMCGIELSGESLPPAGRSRTPAWRIADRLYERGHFTRPIGNVIQLVPPLCVTRAELAAFVETLHETLA